MSDEILRRLERELSISGRTLKQWAHEILLGPPIADNPGRRLEATLVIQAVNVDNEWVQTGSNTTIRFMDPTRDFYSDIRRSGVSEFPWRAIGNSDGVRANPPLPPP